ncbi:hypothetical protein SG34_022575 [Thalassomonas viridans]|uniref:Uncharacterized protein n=1 Tax=Thalassomonas viridans TaxID=137584 RepID=A0AAE9YZN8_9GAMM|nr:hypothetical protein [Thalassomonas viridans]WDE04116.1 hypothetical protein SG34_022575 [Thalassomonas viridans]
MRLVIPALLLCFMATTALGKDLLAQKNAGGKVVAVMAMNEEAVNKRITLPKLMDVVPRQSFNVLNNYYYWGYRDDIKKILSLYAREDGSWQRLKKKAGEGKSPFKNFSKLQGVSAKSKYFWGDYEIFKVVWDVKDKSYKWLDTLYCRKPVCQYSDILLRFNDLESAVSGVLTQAQDNLKVDKSGLSAFELYPIGSARNPLTFYYDFKAVDHSIWPATPAKSKYPHISNYFKALHESNLKDDGVHKQFEKKYWRPQELDIFIANYSYENSGIRALDYSLAAYNHKIFSYDQVSVVGEISVPDGTLVLCRGQKADGTAELFFMPLTDQGKLYVPQGDNFVWTFVNSTPFARHLDRLANK